METYIKNRFHHHNLFGLSLLFSLIYWSAYLTNGKTIGTWINEGIFNFIAATVISGFIGFIAGFIIESQQVAKLKAKYDKRDINHTLIGSLLAPLMFCILSSQLQLYFAIATTCYFSCAIGYAFITLFKNVPFKLRIRFKGLNNLSKWFK